MGDDQDPMARARQAGLLGFGATALQAGAPSLTPTSLGSILGQSVMAGQQASQQTLQQARQQAIQQQMMGTMGEVSGSGDVGAKIAQLQKMALLDPKNQAAYLKIAEQLQGKAPMFTGETANAALSMFGTSDVSKLTPEQRQQATEAADAARVRAGNAAAPRMTVNTSDPTAVAREIRAVTNDFSSLMKDPSAIAKTYKVMENAVENPTAAGDISLVFNYFKTIDPASTVREGEYATIINSGSVPERIKNYAQQLQSGRKLNPDQRADLLNTARQNVLALAPQVNQTVNLYRNLVTSLKEDPDKIIRNPFEDILVAAPGSGQPPSAAAPSATPNRRRWNPQTGEFEYGR
jgi:hypothetical protein